jgi:hypothetical protein
MRERRFEGRPCFAYSDVDFGNGARPEGGLRCIRADPVGADFIWLYEVMRKVIDPHPFYVIKIRMQL